MLTFSFTHLLAQHGFGKRLTRRKFTTTILLIVESIFFQQLVSTFLQTTLPPVLCPEIDTANSLLSSMTSTFYLLQTFPTTGGQCRSKIFDIEFCCFSCSSHQSNGKTLFTTSSTFRLTFQSTDTRTPRFMIVVIVYPFNAQRGRMTLTLLFAYLILFTRPYIGIIIVDGWAHTIRNQPFNNG